MKSFGAHRTHTLIATLLLSSFALSSFANFVHSENATEASNKALLISQSKTHKKVVTGQKKPVIAHKKVASQKVFVNKFIDRMVKKHHFKREELNQLFDQVVINEHVVKKMNHPYEAKPWDTYRRFFVTPKRIKNGLSYLRAHEKSLTEAEKKYGVPREVIAAVIGIETDYGRRMGNFSVLQSLSTLAFNYPSRARFFTRELEEFLLLTRSEKLDPLSIQGSYAGAIGLPQFMPSSYRAYAVSAKGKGSINLVKNHDDAIFSVAHYLKHHGWQKDQQIAIPVEVTGDKYLSVLNNKFRPQLAASSLAQYGIKPKQNLKATQKTVLIKLNRKKGEEFWLGLKNYYVISRYNHNKQYVLVVNEISQALAKKSLAHPTTVKTASL